jgi:two-component system sensor histidine kinase RstB
MLKFFIRFYLGLVTALLLSLLVAAILLGQQYEASVAQENIWLTRALNSQIQQRLQQAPTAQWPALIEQMVGDYPFTVDRVAVTALSKVQRRQLLSNGVAVRLGGSLLTDDISIYYPLPQDPERVLHYRANSQLYAGFNWILLVQLCGLLLGIGLSVWLLARPLVRHIYQLAQVSRAIGAGHLQARADENVPAPLGKLARDINGMAAQLDQLLQEQEAMTGAVAHELRAPIANLRFALDLTRNSREVEQLREQIAEMDVDIDALDALVDELLTYARLRHSGNASSKHSLLLKPLLAQMLDNLEPLQPELDYQLVCDADVKLVANQRDLLRALSNLLRNAQRYAHQQVQIRVQQRGDQLLVAVEDDGPGIPLAERQRVLLPFTRLDQSRSRSSGGYGLGLAIVQRIVQQHQGHILIEGSALGGSRICLHLPR